MKLDVVFVIPPHVVARRVDEEIVVLDLEGGNYFGLDPVGARAWELIGERLSLAEICDKMETEYDVERGTLERDIRHLVAALQEEKLLMMHE